MSALSKFGSTVHRAADLEHLFPKLSPGIQSEQWEDWTPEQWEDWRRQWTPEQLAEPPPSQ